MNLIEGRLEMLKNVGAIFFWYRKTLVFDGFFWDGMRIGVWI